MDLIYCCFIRELNPGTELIDEFLAGMELNFSSWRDHECGGALHTVYADNSAEANAVAERLRSLLPEWRRLGLSVNSIETGTIKREDWAEVWKRHFKVEKVSPRLVIRPSWLTHNAESNEIIIDIDPGMTFGTGQHPTTRFCMNALDELAAKGHSGSFLDAGCGSGILSIAAFKLGYKPISAFDFDPACQIVCRENFAKNAMPETAVALETADVAEVVTRPEKYHVVAANIISKVLKTNAAGLAEKVAPGGHLILAGILVEEYDEVSELFKRAGLREKYSKTDGEWSGGLFRQSPPM